MKKATKVRDRERGRHLHSETEDSRVMPPISDEEPGLGQDGTLNRADCLCPICLEIFLEPVTLPCTHTFCKPCFLETVDKANICCPLCRKRVSNWARLNSRNKTLVNTELWRRIQDAFPTQCQRRLNGVGEEEEDVNMFMQKPRVSQPGELRREYEEEINKFVEEKRALEEAERKASEEYIQRLLAEEQERVEEERRRQEERQLEDDERLARLLSEELNASPILETQRNNKVNESSKKKKSNVGHIEKYLTPYTQSHCETKQSSTRLDNKENILNTSASSIELHSLDSSNKPSTSSSGPETCNQLFDTSNITNSYAKRKSADGEQAVTCKKPCTSPSPSSPLHDCAFLQEMAEQEEGFRIRLQQEEEDRRLALRLQRELNREYNVDRRKGSADSYLLREKNSPSFSSSSSPGEENKTGRACSPHSSRQKVDGHKAGKRANNQVEGRSLKTSSSSTPVSPSTSSSVQKGRKQTTLTEMFPSPGN